MIGEQRVKSAFVAILGVFLVLMLAPGAAGASSVYVANVFDESVSVIDTETNEVKTINGSREITVGKSPEAVAITPDGRTAYVANEESEGVSVIDTTANQVETINGSREIKVGKEPCAIAITPDGKFAYIANEGSEGVSVIDIATNEVKTINGSREIKVGTEPDGIAITPDGKTAYVTNFLGGVSVIDTTTNQVETINGRGEITVGKDPNAIAITPDGRFVYVSNDGSASVSVIDTATNDLKAVPGGTEIKVGTEPNGIAITPDGKTAYVTNFLGGVSVIGTATNEVEMVNGSTEIKVGREPEAIAITPDGKSAYVANGGKDSVSVIDTATNTVKAVPGGTEIKVGGRPAGISVAPDQSPIASFTSPRARPAVPLTFDASASKDSDSAISTYAWSFGDGQSAAPGAVTTTHTFAEPGSYRVTLKEIDAEGCSISRLFTGQTASCNGKATAQTTQTIKVAYPGVSVRCPKRAKPKGCTFKLQAISKKPKKGKAPQAESLLARAKAKPGRSTVVSLQPKQTFAERLATADLVLVKETVVARGLTKTRFVKLKIVQ